MLTTQIQATLFSSLKKNIYGETRSRRHGSIISIANKKDDFPQKSTPNSTLKIVSQAAIAVLGLGFIDAGYSGDWSRIGVISKENEDFLKIAAFLVVPMCFFLIYSISKVTDE